MKRFLLGMKADIFSLIKGKTYGFYVACVAALLLFVMVCLYSFVPNGTYNSLVILFGCLGFVLFLVFSLFKETSSLSAIALMVFSFTAFCAFVNADGLIDYLSTVFFSGFSLSVLFSLPFPLLFSIFAMLFAFLISSVAMYLPQQKKRKEERKELENENA